MGHVDDYLPDSGMQVTIAFNRFGPGLVQRMPRCRRGYIHVVNNDYTYWEMYAIGGSANPTINSQGNRYTAPGDQNAKEVTKRVDTDESEWSSWNWRTDGDIMVNGAFFVPSGAGLETKYSKAESVEPRSSAMIDQLTMNAGVLGSDPRRNEGAGPAGYGTGGAGGGVGGGQYGYDWGMIFGSDASALLNHSFLTTSFGFILLIVILLTSDFWLL